jgi:hypothetical protein
VRRAAIKTATCGLQKHCTRMSHVIVHHWLPHGTLTPPVLPCRMMVTWFCMAAQMQSGLQTQQGSSRHSAGH